MTTERPFNPDGEDFLLRDGTRGSRTANLTETQERDLRQFCERHGLPEDLFPVLASVYLMGHWMADEDGLRAAGGDARRFRLVTEAQFFFYRVRKETTEQ
jgi:hypothetical protein